MMGQNNARLIRAQGCLMGQIAGDSLGSLVEFETPAAIRRAYPGSVRELANGGTHHTIAGQPTDDSEMALLLARMLADRGTYDTGAAFAAYQFWLDSGPFDCGNTIGSALRGRLNHQSQANGAMMRISPLGIFGANHDLLQVAACAKEDAALTHPHPVCQQANALFAMAIAYAINTGADPAVLYHQLVEWTVAMDTEKDLIAVIYAAEDGPPQDFMTNQGWVLVAFQNALYQLLHAPTFTEGVVDSVMRGGDTDTNAAICGALLGAVHGLDAMPVQWQEKVLSCRPAAGTPGVVQPRPEIFWPVDALELVEMLLR